ncbi:MAG: hypothetical protein K2R98_20915 [Gemmataceae bacterium]|nr:hypothetical protein [Gemmataceae bacterium]
MSEYELKGIIKWFMVESPLFLALLAGFIWALATWAKHPQASLMAALAAGLWLAKLLIFFVLYRFMPRWFSRSSDFESYETIYTILQFFSAIADGCLFLLLMAAAMMGHKAPRRAEPDARGPAGDDFQSFQR